MPDGSDPKDAEVTDEPAVFRRSMTPASWRARIALSVLVVFMLGTYLLIPRVFTPGSQPRNQSQTLVAVKPFHPSERAELIAQLRSAEAAAQRMALHIDDDPEVTHGEAVQVLRMLQTVADPRLEPLRTDPEFQDLAGSMLLETLRSGAGNVPVNPAIFEIIGFLPQSERLSEIVSTAFALQASSNHLWLDLAYEKLTQAEIERIRSGMEFTPVANIPIWKLHLLAIDGSDASQSLLERLLADARAAESRPGPRTQSRGLVPELERLTALRQARSDTSTLTQWAVARAGSGSPASGLWAFQEVLAQTGPESELWRGAWRDLDAVIWARTEYLAERVGTHSAAQVRRLDDLRLRAAGSHLLPWVEWSDRHGVPVPTSVRMIIDKYEPYPFILTGC